MAASSAASTSAPLHGEIAEQGAGADRDRGQPAFERRLIKREPHGVVLVIAPWNYPYMTAINTVAPALIAGNAVILKHATQTLKVGERMAAPSTRPACRRTCSRTSSSTTTTEALIGGRRFDFVNFTGSVGGGRPSSARPRAPSPVSTELGGKDPGYVMDDADLDWAVDTLMDGAMFNSGQCCCGIERIYVAGSALRRLRREGVAWAEKLKLGNPLDPDTTIGPMANVRFAARCARRSTRRCRGGARHIDPNAVSRRRRRRLSDAAGPVDVTHDMRVMREESFGPVVGIMPVKDDEEAIALMNDCQFGLTASLWTRDAARPRQIGDRIETGTVFMNRCRLSRPGAVLDRLQGHRPRRRLSVIGFHNLTRPKSYHI
jgi:acyl-CoA reductase-like NAD-dependent aldehyde dehydrogenase